jgi:hypothetical protein
MAEFDQVVWVWWLCMSAVGVLNVALWLRMAKTMRAGPLLRHERYQLLLSGIYVAGCASRCVVLRSDVARFAMFDSWFSTVLVGRSIATVAEVAFAAQWALLLLWLVRQTGQHRAKWLAYPLVPLLTTAQCCAWFGVLTTNYIGQTVEESLWTTAAGLFMTGMFLCRRTASASLKPFLTAGLVLCAAYMVFMITIDVPNYYTLWQANEASGKTYLSFAEGVRSVQEMKITGSYEDWRYPMVWQTLYFSVAVWISLAMVAYPFHLRQTGKAKA